MPSSTNKRIAKNTMLLYFRMILIMGITLYTSRIVLTRLGVNDFGIYNVVGGVVTLFSLFSSALTGAITRFITYELGATNGNVQRIFSNSLTILLSIGILIAVLVETGGTWFLNNKMQIATERLYAANWVLQCSVITFIINLLSVPYNALIIAHEKMGAFAYISMLEACLKLGVAFALYIKFLDSLILYSILITIVSLIIRWSYSWYANKHFNDGRFKLKFDKSIFKTILSFTGWTSIGGGASILNSQGVNMLLNIYWGTTVNAARGLAVQVNSAVIQFSTNFMVAVNPQIIKRYASNEKDSMNSLILQSSRFAFFLMFMIAFPIIMETERVLRIWLDSFPPYTSIFIKLVLIHSLIDALCLSLQTANQATGKVKIYQIVAGGTLMLNFPLSWIGLYLGMSPSWVYVVSIIISTAGIFARLIVLRRLISLTISQFLKKVIVKCLVVVLVSLIFPLLIKLIFNSGNSTSIFLIISCFVSAGFSIWFVGLDYQERKIIKDKIRKIIKITFNNANFSR